ncbi:MAG TPA: diguanylate cyclase response regulator [Thermodesulfobacteriota bacterium]|nr:diguanylate cyclase response regulator [Thermodesulfobacteriota bacterium]
MKNNTIRVLLIEDDLFDARMLKRTLARATLVEFKQTHVDRLSEALKLLERECFEVILLDLSLPDSFGLDTFTDLRSQSPDIPIVVLTGLDDETLAFEAVQKGAQDYLVKGQVDSNLLVRSIRYAIERHRTQVELRGLSLIDDLTGLHNRRGFLMLAQQQIKIANRTKKGFLIFFADVDNMKWVNDILGHNEGDMALVETASLLRETFRESDIISRLGGDEFVVLALDVSGHNVEAVTTSLQNNLNTRNAKNGRRYMLSISLGTAYYNPKRPTSVEELLTQADTQMYEQKRGRKRAIS